MKIKDERIVREENKINSEAYYLVLFLATTSILIKSYVLDLPAASYTTELVVILVSILYVAVRSMMRGVDMMNNEKFVKRISAAFILLGSLASSIMIAVKNYSLYHAKYTGVFDWHFIATIIVTFISSVIFLAAVFAVFYALNKAGQKRIERKLHEEDQKK